MSLLHGERILFGHTDLKLIVIEESAWNRFDKAIGLKTSNEIRERLKFHLELYGMAGSLYAPGSTRLATDIVPRLDRWLRESLSLLQTLQAEEANIQSRTEYMELFASNRLENANKLVPLQFLRHASRSAVAAARIAKREIDGEQRNRPVENDLWPAWVCLTAKILKSAGLKISGASTDKSPKQSPFITGLMTLQTWLPKECRRLNTYESVRVAAQQSLNMDRMNDESLLQILIWELQPRSPYPGDLRRASKDKMAAFESLVKEMRAKPAFIDVYALYPHLRPSAKT
jgi:hypothetical protein